jgi:hypothetical protein
MGFVGAVGGAAHSRRAAVTAGNTRSSDSAAAAGAHPSLLICCYSLHEHDIVMTSAGLLSLPGTREAAIQRLLQVRTLDSFSGVTSLIHHLTVMTC